MRPFFIRTDDQPLLISGSRFPYWMMINDVTRFLDHAEEISQWLTGHGCTQQGMFVVFPDGEIMTLFILRWC